MNEQFCASYTLYWWLLIVLVETQIHSKHNRKHGNLQYFTCKLYIQDNNSRFTNVLSTHKTCVKHIIFFFHLESKQYISTKKTHHFFFSRKIEYCSTLYPTIYNNEQKLFFWFWKILLARKIQCCCFTLFTWLIFKSLQFYV